MGRIEKIFLYTLRIAFSLIGLAVSWFLIEVSASSPMVTVMLLVVIALFLFLVWRLSILGLIVLGTVTLTSAFLIFLPGQPRYGRSPYLANCDTLTLPQESSFTFSNTALAYRPKSRDGRRITDVKQTQLALDLYYEKFGAYPKVEGGVSYECWQDLSPKLAPDFLPQLPRDPCFPKPKERQYDYKNSPDAKSYVIRAILDEPTNPALGGDRDGEVLGVWCGDEGKEIEYCVGP